MKALSVRPEYVESIPRELADGVLYVSRKYGTASHRCCCGCGTKIVTPLRETEYTLTERSGAVSLSPSIGNWNHPCQSHYWITDNQVVWTGKMTQAQIRAGRAHDDALKQTYFSQQTAPWWQRAGNWVARAVRKLLG
jgi:hypothetical protein